MCHSCKILVYGNWHYVCYMEPSPHGSWPLPGWCKIPRKAPFSWRNIPFLAEQTCQIQPMVWQYDNNDFVLHIWYYKLYLDYIIQIVLFVLALFHIHGSWICLQVDQQLHKYVWTRWPQGKQAKSVKCTTQSLDVQKVLMLPDFSPSLIIVELRGTQWSWWVIDSKENTSLLNE